MAVFVGVPCSSLRNSRLCTFSKIFGRCLKQGKDSLSGTFMSTPACLYRFVPANEAFQCTYMPTQAHIVPGGIYTCGTPVKLCLRMGLPVSEVCMAAHRPLNIWHTNSWRGASMAPAPMHSRHRMETFVQLRWLYACMVQPRPGTCCTMQVCTVQSHCQDLSWKPLEW